MAENTLCSECNGTGHISEGSLFVNPGEKPPESKTCPRCNGLGYVKRRFFVEYTFNSKLSDNVYWLPLFISADSNDEAFKIVKATKVALEEYNENVTYTYPILDEGKLASQHIDQKYKALWTFYRFHYFIIPLFKTIPYLISPIQNIITPSVLMGKAIPIPKSTAPNVNKITAHFAIKFERYVKIPKRIKPTAHGMALNIN